MRLVGKDYVGKANRLSNDGATAAGGTWTTVFDKTGQPTADDTGNNGFTFVNVLALSDLSQTGGTQIRLTFDGASSEGAEFSAVYVGNGGGSDAYDFTGDQVQMKQSGGNTITVPAGGSVVTDGISFVKDGSNSLVIAFQCQNSAKDNLLRHSASTAMYLKSGADASTQNKTGYSAYTTGAYVHKVELLI